MNSSRFSPQSLLIQNRKQFILQTIRPCLFSGRDGRVVECGGLENRCPVRAGPWVRIPLSPPDFALRASPGTATFLMRRAYDSYHHYCHVHRVSAYPVFRIWPRHVIDAGHGTLLSRNTRHNAYCSCAFIQQRIQACHLVEVHQLAHLADIWGSSITCRSTRRLATWILCRTTNHCQLLSFWAGGECYPNQIVSGLVIDHFCCD